MLATVMLYPCLFTFRPHPEERGTRVSKDGPRVPLPPSFETLASQAPQDEVCIPDLSTPWFETALARLLTMTATYALLHPAHRRTSGADRFSTPPARTSCPSRTDRRR